jgi:uncharacterized protein YjbI with pentapeptide repeats
MRARFRSWWQKIRQHPFRVAGIIVLIFALTAFSIAVIKFGWDWTGFTGGEIKVTKTIITPGTTTATPGTSVATEQQPAKTLWDWLTLLGILAIPVVVGLGAVWYTAQQEKVRASENTDLQRETALQTYIDKMSELLHEGVLNPSVPDPTKINIEQIRGLARARTLMALRRLDSNRKGILLQFLYDTDLINKVAPIIDLSTAAESVDITAVADLILVANLSEANLRDAYLHTAKLNGINLRKANLRRATLIGADLSGADLSGADLHGANLTDAILNKTKLSEANLSKANLTRAILTDAKISGADLREANLTGIGMLSEELEKNSKPAKEVKEERNKNKLLKGAIMPDGSTHP